MKGNADDKTYPTAVPLSEVADPATLWALVLEGERMPAEDVPEC